VDEQYINLGLVSLILVLFLGAAILFLVLFKKSKPQKKDFNSEISSYDRLYREGKLTRQEYNQIRITLMQKYGGNLPPEILQAGSVPPSRPSSDSKANTEEKPESETREK
jgi:hypothetical protein